MFIKGLNREIDENKVVEMLDLFESDIVLLTGSLIEGMTNSVSINMGNELSDIDIYIIRENKNFYLRDYVYDEGYSVTYFKKYDNVNYDISVFRKDDVEFLFKEIDKIHFENRKRILNSLKLPNYWDLRATNEFINRIHYSINIKGKKEWDLLYKKLNLSLYCDLYKRHLMTYIDNAYEDILGNVQSKQYETALYCIRYSYMLLIQVALYNEKETLDREKWAVLKLENLVNIDSFYKIILDKYYEIFYLIDREKAKSIKFYTQILQFMNDIIVQMEDKDNEFFNL